MFSLEAEDRISGWLAHDAADANPDVRETALDRLGALRGPTRLLVCGLVDPDPEVRGTAAANLGVVRRSDAWPPLASAARAEASDDVLRHIVAALASYRDHSILETLLEILSQTTREYAIRMEAARQLWKYEPADVVPQLLALVRGDDHELVRRGAADSLDLIQQILPYDQVRHEIWLQLTNDSHLGLTSVASRALEHEQLPVAEDILAVLSRCVQDSSPNERSFALHRVGLLAPTSALTLASASLIDDHPEVRAAGCACLGAIRDDAAIPVLLRALRSDPHPRVRTAALLGLEKYRTADIGESLLTMLAAGGLGPDQTSIVCRQLWKYPSIRTVELLHGVLGSAGKLPHRRFAESALAFLERLARAGSPDGPHPAW